MHPSTYTPRFQSIEFKSTPWTRWAGSLLINSGVLIALALIPATLSRNLQPEQKVTAVSLVVPPAISEYKPVPRPHIVQRVVVPSPPPQPAKVVKKEFQAPVPRTPELQAPKPLPALVDVARPIETARFQAPEIQLARPPSVFPPSVFPPSNEAPPNPAPVRVVKTGGFGDPNGVAASPSANKPSALAQVGSFDLSPGAGRGSGSGGNGKVLVASAGFGDGTAAGSNSASGGNGRGAVQAGGFAGYDTNAARPVKAAAPAAPAQTPVEIIYKPKPAYTPEAREKKIEGDVQLEVLFSSAGQIQVLRLIRGLGYGLDESARAAASQIRFRPGTRNGAPVDVTGTVHIIFQIS
jgi:TonB family protein